MFGHSLPFERYSNQDIINDFFLLIEVEHCEEWNINWISKLSYVHSWEWLVWQTFSSAWWSWLVELASHRNSLTSVMCMWQEKLELIDGVHTVRGFDDWILKYQISEASLSDPCPQGMSVCWVLEQRCSVKTLDTQSVKEQSGGKQLALVKTKKYANDMLLCN